MPEREVHIGHQLVLQPDVGLLQLAYQSKALVSGATAGVMYDTADGRIEELSLQAAPASYGMTHHQASLGTSNQDVRLTWQLTAGEEPRLALEVTNLARHEVHIHELWVLDVNARGEGSLGFRSAPANWRFYQNGWQSWSPTFARCIDGGLWVNPNTEEYRTKHLPHGLAPGGRGLTSEWFTVIVPEQASGRGHFAAKPALLLGFISTADQLSEVRLELDPRYRFQRLRAISHADKVVLRPGEKLSSEVLVLLAGDEPLELMDQYADLLGRSMRARVPDRVPTGWCTWYYFFGKDTANDVFDNLARIEEERLPLGTILIDDGYQTEIGDWLEVDSDKYPQGMKEVAARVSDSGFRSGIWTAPFAVSAFSKLYAAHPDWVLRDREGQPLVAWRHKGEEMYGLDLSRDEVLDWLRQLFQTLSADWGFEFFKVDFLFAGALEGTRHNPGLTRAQAVRRGLETIRSAIGERFLLGCGAPLGPAIGMVDGMRIGPDVHVDWEPLWQDLSAPAASNAILNSVTRSFLHRRLWLNDPDCLPLRLRGDDSNLVLNEMRTLVTVAGLSGGLVFNSDNLPSIRWGRPRYLRCALPPYGQSAVPLDLFQNERPALLVLPVYTDWDSWTIVALLNWDDRSRTTELDLGQLALRGQVYHAYNYWRKRYLGVVRGKLVIEPHQPHETVLLLLKPVADELQLLTSTFHVLQGAVEITHTVRHPERIVASMVKPGRQFGSLLFAVPEALRDRVPTAKVNGRVQQPRQVANGIWRVGLTLRDRATVEFALQ
jgi:alpha-galactosidase